MLNHSVSEKLHFFSKNNIVKLFCTGENQSVQKIGIFYAKSSTKDPVKSAALTLIKD